MDYIYSSGSLEQSIANREDILFSIVPFGGDYTQPNGPVTDHFGWEHFSLGERFGIEKVIGISGFNNEVHFKSWVEDCLGVPLDDWEGCVLTLYKCWMPSLQEQFPSIDPVFAYDLERNYSYSCWRYMPETDAVRIIPMQVYAIRHRAYSLLGGDGRSASFHEAWYNSYMVVEDKWLTVRNIFRHPTIVLPQE